MPSPTILPAPDQLQLISLSADATAVTLSVQTTRRVAKCPLCDEEAIRIHSHYLRHLDDLPL